MKNNSRIIIKGHSSSNLKSKLYKYIIHNFSKLNNVIYDPNNDYYKILNVPEYADIKFVKNSFYKLSLEFHPDKGGNEEYFKKINSAYETLKDPELKRKYDSIRQEFIFSFKSKYDKDGDYNTNKNSHNKKENSYSSFKNKNNWQNNEYYNKNRYQNFYKNNQNRNYKTNYNSNHDFHNDNYSSKSNSNQHQYNNNEKYDFEKEYNYQQDYVNDYFLKYFNNFFKKSNFYNQKYNSGFEKEEKINRKNESEKIFMDSVNDFNFLNNNIDDLDDKTINYFHKFKINKQISPKSNLKINKYIFTKQNIHFSDNRIKKIEELERIYSNRSIYKKIFAFKKNKFEKNPFEINISNKNSSYDISDAMNSKTERDSERMNKRITFQDLFNVFEKKYFISFCFFIFFINYKLFYNTN